MDPLIVVCGAASDAVRGTLAGLPLHIVDNPAWKNGMGSSIHVGLAAACEYDVDAVILSLGDQPLLEAQTFGALVTAWQREGKGVVTSEYSGTVGAPALFARSMFDNLKALPADRGCKKAILELPASMVTRCACPQAAVDIDTPDEYGRLLSASAWPEQTR
jgi:molybdenum cofactor cytidylyltransferase